HVNRRRFQSAPPMSPGDLEWLEAPAHYDTRSRRVAGGVSVEVSDGAGRVLRGPVAEVGQTRVRVQLDQQFAGQAESPLRIDLPRRRAGPA
ncbi:hypothetical protein B1218_37075, partial [Pseudomonas ogarae]